MRHKRLVQGAVGVAIVAVAACVVWEFGMSDAAKCRIKRAARSAKESFEAVRDVVSRTQGVETEAPDPTANRQAVEQQWAQLGF